MNYKDTINLFETEFPMRGDLAKREPQMLDNWYKENRYEKIRQICQGRTKFILHDGPPYANGNLHLGHAVNKILKDIIIRMKTLSGYDAPFVPGWDCHGLPIELNVEKMHGKDIPAREFRDKCREYAQSQIENQMKDFIRLGVLGKWDKPYKTMDYQIEAATIRAFGEIYKNGYLFKGVKPVHWCIECKSALAEAEVEYKNKFSSSIYVKFNAINEDKTAILKTFKCHDDENLYNKNISVVIWTTTPWTLPSNEAICVNQDVTYALININNEILIIAKDLVDGILTKPQLNGMPYTIINETLGINLTNTHWQHPFYDKKVPIILGEHVTIDAGTGLVHTAPAHGMEDYMVGMKYNLPLETKVNDAGCFISTANLVNGLNIWDSNNIVIKLLEDNGSLLIKDKLEHSYPHCWRHKTPLIFRTTPQWFIGMDKLGTTQDALRSIALKEVDKTDFIPKWGKARLESMINTRPDWCVSRQRKWFSPITFFVHKETFEPHPDSYQILQKIADLIEKHGMDIWFDDSTNGESLGIKDSDKYQKLTDTIDVWFDSGVTHLTVLKNNTNYPELLAPADLYLEGSDQHRGWFQSSLLTGCAINGAAPFKALLTHGFTVDGKGYKMSKSLGNTVSPQDVIKKYGADLLRLWVASTDYSGELSYSDEIMKRVSESYRRIRNTLRFLLANLVDFDSSKDLVDVSNILEIDKYALFLLSTLQDKLTKEIYPSYQFHHVVQEIVKFCSEDLGGFYLDILKDRLYTGKIDGISRRAAQSTIYHIANSLILLLSPILCFTADEAWEILKHDKSDSTLYHAFYSIPDVIDKDNISAKWTKIVCTRGAVLKKLEEARVNNEIGSSLQANLHIKVGDELYSLLSEFGSDLKFIYMVSHVEVSLITNSDIEVTVTKSQSPKCERCWHYVESVGMYEEHKTICERCIGALGF